MSKFVRSVLFGLLACGPLAAAPAPLPAKYEPPTIVGQVASVQRVIDLAVGFVKSVEPSAAEQMEKGLADLLGEKGWDGLDTKKPIGLFAYLRPKLENSYLVFAVPITKEKDALDLLDRLGVGVEEEPKAKGVYRVRKRGFFPEDSPTRLRFHDGHAYLGINADADELDPAKLLPVASLTDEKETALAAVTFFPGRAPTELKEMFDGWWASGKASMDDLENGGPPGFPKSFPAFAKACLAWTDANTAALFKEGESLRLRLLLDPKTTEYSVEATVTPKAKSGLAADIAAVKPAAGRFHQLAGKGTVGGLWLTVGPSFPKEVRQKGGPFAAELIGMLPKTMPEDLQAVFAELGQGIETAIVDGKADLGLALLGPDADGSYTFVGGLAVPDTAGVEKAYRNLVADLPKEVQGLFKLDAEKAGGVSVHTISLPEEAGMEKVFGKKAVVRVGFGKDAVYVAAGPDGAKQIERAVGLKPAPGKRFDIVADGAKAGKLIADLTGEEPGFGGPGGFFQMLLGKAEGVRSLQGVDVTGGEKLTITYTQNGAGLVGLSFFSLRVR